MDPYRGLKARGYQSRSLWQVVSAIVLCLVALVLTSHVSADGPRGRTRPTDLRSDAAPHVLPVPVGEDAELTAEAVPLEALQSNPQFLPRIGVATNRSPWDYSEFSNLNAGWFHNWSLRPWGLVPIQGLDFYPTVGAYGDLWGEETEYDIRNSINKGPGCYPPGIIWIVGNEPEYDQFETINGQPIPGGARALTPDEYAQKHKKYYDIIKGINPTYQVAVGATYDDPSWPDATRCEFLPKAMQAYENRYGTKMPIDVYTMHAYMDQVGAPNYQVEIMVDRKRQLMKDYGDQGKPLIITELGVLTALRDPVPTAAQINDFMDQAFQYLETATSIELGNPYDDYHLVQRWAWFALTSWHPGDDHKWEGTDLLDIDTAGQDVEDQLTAIGLNYSEYPRDLPQPPSGFWGSVTISGQAAPAGTLVTAWIGDVQCAQAEVFTYGGASVYTLDVPADDPSTPQIDGGEAGDVIGFKIGSAWAVETSVWASGSVVELDLSKEPSAFGSITKWHYSFSQRLGWTSQNEMPRAVADVNGDGMADVIGFKDKGTYVALSDGSSFGPITKWHYSFSQQLGWTSQDAMPRMAADVNGDGNADAIGCKAKGTYVGIAEP